MQNRKSYLLFFIFFCLQISQAQVDVVYTDLVWSDEFDNNGAVNASKWHHQTQLPAGGSWFNGEVQHYTNQLANASVSNGLLAITAKKEPYTDQGITKQYTSARLNSKFAFLYGRVDIRAKIPTNQGTWPAFWMLGKNINEDGAYFDAQFGNTDWPACGEIDIMEHGITPSQPLNYIQSALHTPSSFGNTTNIGGIIANNLGNDFHVYSMNWSPNQITFLLDGVAFYTYNPTIKTPQNWPFNAEQYLLLNIAMGGIAGTIPSNFTQATMEVDYVRVYQNTIVDTTAPTAFTATVGTITSSSVELILNATDNSGNIAYAINYSGGSINTTGLSNTPKSVIISNLSSNTNYTFTIAASDLSGNNFLNNPLVRNATTLSYVGCSGFSNSAQLNSFTTGYNYEFETIGTNVKITFELLDADKTSVFGYLWKQNPFAETVMTPVTDKKFTSTITNQIIGSTINYAVKFAYAGGLSVTQYFSYVVGNNCALGLEEVEHIEFSFANPVSSNLMIHSNSPIDKVEIRNMIGSVVVTTTESTQSIDITNFSNGMYIVTVYSDNKRSVKKMLVNK
ncbi:MAG: family 16 glycosylhydrolase [Flavobacterium sp.]|nr:family 16 glycosylhydrolase [Flavobacterium sp.]